jgi:putative glutathione S-transferase
MGYIIYRCGFAKTPEAYREAVIQLFEALDRAEALLKDKAYFVGDRLTEADIRLFVTIIQFFKCNIRTIRNGYPNIHLWLRRLYWQNDAFQSTTNFDDFDHIKTHYYWLHAHTGINPTRIVPVGPVPHIEPLEADL